MKSHHLRCCGWLTLLNWIGGLTLSRLLKLLLWKLEPWFALWSFFLLRLLCISINLPYRHVWNTVAMSGLLVATWSHWVIYKNRYTQLLVHHQNVASLSLFYRYYFGRCSFELAQLVPLSYSCKRSTGYSDRLHNFSITIPRCCKDIYVNSFFSRTARLWNSLPIYRMLSFDLWPKLL